MDSHEMWTQLSVWMQRRETIEYCLWHYEVDKSEAKHLIKLIDIAIRNRIRHIVEDVEQANLPVMPKMDLPLLDERINERIIRRHRRPKNPGIDPHKID